MNKLNVALELSDKDLKHLQSLIDYSVVDDNDMYSRFEVLEKVVKAIFTAKEYEEQKLKIKHSNNRCICGHEENYHSLLGERVCTSESCYCMSFNKKQ